MRRTLCLVLCLVSCPLAACKPSAREQAATSLDGIRFVSRDPPEVVKVQPLSRRDPRRTG